MKRDIALLDRVDPDPGDDLTVLDVSMRTNCDALIRALERGAHVTYFDHHAPGEIPSHSLLEAHIDTAPEVCTSLIVDRYVAGRHRMWAVVAAFGDNMVASALRAAEPLHLDHTELARLHELGDCLNYNAYGETLDDLHYHPADLYRAISRYSDPRHFIFDEPIFGVLRQAYGDDFYRASEVKADHETPDVAVYRLPDAAWSRRVSGLFANRLAQSHPSRAHAILVGRGTGYNVSVRAPIDRPRGTSELCHAFGGGGREGAGGIDCLASDDAARFIEAFEKTFRR